MQSSKAGAALYFALVFFSPDAPSLGRTPTLPAAFAVPLGSGYAGLSSVIRKGAPPHVKSSDLRVPRLWE